VVRVRGRGRPRQSGDKRPGSQPKKQRAFH
jgi:hypothetical protein